MFPSKALLSLVFVTLSLVDASPLDRRSGKASLSFSTKINRRGALNIAEKDRARAQAMRRAGKLGKRSATLSLTNNVITYVAQVGVGDPATNYTLIVDTGSANTFVGAGKAYVQTKSSYNTGDSVSVEYGSGNWYGEEWNDTVTLSPNLVIKNQSIGVASTSEGFSGVDGILGVGPVDLTDGTVSGTNTVPTVSDNLFSQGTISVEALGVYFVPASEKDSHGELTFGGYDADVITDSVDYAPLTTITPASEFWGVDGSITYGADTVLSSTAGMVDTGTTLILIASNAFQTYQSLTGGTVDNTTGLLTITSAQYANLKTLTFKLGHRSYGLTPNGQIWPRSLNTRIGGSAGFIYLVVSSIGASSGSGLDFTLGYSFHERFYTVYDTTHGRVGFANTRYTASTSN